MKPPDPLSPLMTVDEAATYLRFLHPDGTPNRSQFYNWKRRARPRCFRLGKDARNVRFRREDLEAVLVEEAPAAPLVLRGFGGRRRP